MNGVMSELLTTRQVQDLLQVDRTTIYRMVESGRLPALRVGKQWRFARDAVADRLGVRLASETPARGEAPDLPRSNGLQAYFPLECAQLTQDAFAEMLGVMMVVTDMEGKPITRPSNPPGFFLALTVSDPLLTACRSAWQQLAADLVLRPRLAPGDTGLLCARGLIRVGSELQGMVLIGGIAPVDWPPTRDEVRAMAARHGTTEEALIPHLEEVHRPGQDRTAQAVGFVERVADIFSHMIDERARLETRLQAIASLAVR